MAGYDQGHGVALGSPRLSKAPARNRTGRHPRVWYKRGRGPLPNPRKIRNWISAVQLRSVPKAWYCTGMTMSKEHDWEAWRHVAVFVSENASGDQLRELGRHMEAWRTSEPAVGEIDGLSNLLNGKRPTQSPVPHLITGPQAEALRVLSSESSSEAEKSAAHDIFTACVCCPVVICVKPDVVLDRILDALRDATKGTAATSVTDYDQWCDVNR